MLVVLPESKSFYSAHDVTRCRVWSQHRILITFVNTKFCSFFQQTYNVTRDQISVTVLDCPPPPPPPPPEEEVLPLPRAVTAKQHDSCPSEFSTEI